MNATLPSVFTALAVRATIIDATWVRAASSQAPSNCGDLPSNISDYDLAAKELLDQPCIQAVIAPSLILGLEWLPIAILYEPPGNCSWANLTGSSRVGTTFSFTRAEDKETSMIHVEGPFWDREQSSTYDEIIHMESKERGEETLTDSTGTRLGLPISSPGDPRCNQPGTAIPSRDGAGPGRGDMFALIKKSDLLAWSTGGKTNGVFDPQTSPQVFWFTAWQIATGRGISPSAHAYFTELDKSAILGLDPFIDLNNPVVRDSAGHIVDVRVLATPRLENSNGRFVILNWDRTYGAGYGFEHTISQALKYSDNKTLAEKTKDNIGATLEDPVQAITMNATGKAIQGGAEALGTALNTALPGSNSVINFSTMAKELVSSVLPLYVDKTTVTTSTTLSSNDSIEHSLSDQNSQQFFVMDTTRSLSVQLFYDRLFGTYLFRERSEMPPETGPHIIKQPFVAPTPIINRNIQPLPAPW